MKKYKYIEQTRSSGPKKQMCLKRRIPFRENLEGQLELIKYFSGVRDTVEIVSYDEEQPIVN